MTITAAVRPTPDAIISAVGRRMHLAPADITGGSRLRRVTTGRHLAMFLVRELTDLSLTEIGAVFGGRDHSTVHYGEQRIREVVEAVPDGRVAADAAAVRDELLHPTLDPEVAYHVRGYVGDTRICAGTVVGEAGARSFAAQCPHSVTRVDVLDLQGHLLTVL